MKIMYIMPRFHTNLVPTINGWIQNGHEITILTHSTGRIEDYSQVEPIVVGYSKAFNLFLKLYTRVIKRNDPIAKDIALRIGIPNKSLVKRLLLEKSPDLVILREKSFYTIVCNRICKKYGIKTLLYNQSPLVAEPGFFDKKDIPHIIVNSLSPQYRITPVYNIGISLDNKVRDESAEFAPFVMDVHCDSSAKEYFVGGNINILEVGKYEKRKNHFMMVDAFEKLLDYDKSVRLTIVGEKSNKFHEAYYSALKEYVDNKKLAEFITLKFNLSKDKMASEYRKADLFVLSSTGEPAAISHIEAMSYSVPAICSTGNGTADYIIDGTTGFIFKDKDANELLIALKKAIIDKKQLLAMGHNACNRIREHCSFEKYYSSVMKQMSKE